jgi:hypothetical protein
VNDIPLPGPGVVDQTSFAYKNLLGYEDDPSSGGPVTISSGSLPAATTQSVTDIPATYSMIAATLVGASSDTATRLPLIRVSVDNGATYDSTAGNYAGQQSAGGAIADTTLASLAGDLLAAAAATTWDITVILKNYQGGGGRMVYEALSRSSVGNAYFTQGIYIGSVENIDAIQFLWNGTGNFDAGTFTVQGYS